LQLIPLLEDEITVYEFFLEKHALFLMCQMQGSSL